ncbi:hypothetical protein D3C71_1115010 [compost metagenome]
MSTVAITFIPGMAYLPVHTRQTCWWNIFFGSSDISVLIFESVPKSIIDNNIGLPFDQICQNMLCPPGFPLMLFAAEIGPQHVQPPVILCKFFNLAIEIGFVTFMIWLMLIHIRVQLKGLIRIGMLPIQERIISSYFHSLLTESIHNFAVKISSFRR